MPCTVGSSMWASQPRSKASLTRVFSGVGGRKGTPTCTFSESFHHISEALTLKGGETATIMFMLC